MLTQFLTNIANAIRLKNGKTDPINAQDFAFEIAGIPTNVITLPDKIVYFNDFNGREVNKIGAYWEGVKSSSTTTIQPSPNDYWVDKRCLVMTDTTMSRAIRFYSDTAKILNVNSGFSIGAWIKWTGYDTDNNGYNALIFRVYDGSNSAAELTLSRTSHNLGFIGAYTDNTPPLKVDNWYHIACTFSPSATSGSMDIAFYFNGIKQHVGTKTINSGISKIFIGTNSALKAGLYGSIKNPFCSEGPLTDAEIRTMMLMD